MKYLKKYWFIIVIIIVSILRFIFTYNLPNFYIIGLKYDDALMVNQFRSIFNGEYLGVYSNYTLSKGVLFPFVLFIIRIYRMSYSNGFTILYILSSIYFINSLRKIIKSERMLALIYIFLLFNPASFSQDIFQRLYRNSISMIELLFYLGSVVNILFNKKEKIINYLLFGLSLSLLFLTREDNLWTYPIILFVFVYKIIKNKNIRKILYSVIPIGVLVLSLNLVSFVNYKHYKIYTYNEIQKSEFHDTYKKILQIKDDEKIHKVSIPKSTLYKLADNSKKFQITREEIDEYYNKKTGGVELTNGNIIWSFRDLVYDKFMFEDGESSEKYYKELGEEIDELFAEGILKKEFVMPSTYMAVPTKKDIIDTFKNVIYTIFYSSSYKDVKTFTKVDNISFLEAENTYKFHYRDYHHTVNIVKKNDLKYEIYRVFFKYMTLVFGIIAIIIYVKNIFKFDSISILSHLIIIMYLLIIGGVAYTHTTSFHAIRPIYLANIYILQTVFILINIYKLCLHNTKCKYTR